MIETYVKSYKEEILELIRELCKIPAPSFHEEKRAEFCKAWLEQMGAEGVYIDEVKNVIFPINCEGSDEITVFSAHTDTVFSDMEPMELREDEKNIYCPGIGDDTASVAVLLYVARFFVENHIIPKKGVLFVCNSCEEGLGNLVGIRRLMKDFKGRIKQLVSFDSNTNVMNDSCVGSHRYEVEIATEGGHSFQAFGNKNAIAELSKIVAKIYEIVPPTRQGIRTTYNVGIIEGGTSVNTIAQSAKMLCEYRSDDAAYLEIMRQKFAEIFENAKSDEVAVKVTQIGERPCADVDEEKQAQLAGVCQRVIEEVVREEIIRKSASTDCNIPLSMGIPAVCIGVYKGDGPHTREEYIEKEEMETGLAIGLRVAPRATMHQLLKQRSKDFTVGLMTDRRMFQSVIPYWETKDRKITKLELLPIECAMQGNKSEVGLPRIATNLEFVDRLAEMSAYSGIRMQVGKDSIVACEW